MACDRRLGLEGTLDGGLHCLDVVGLYTYDVTAECLFDSVHELPRCTVMDEIDGHTLSTEPARSSCEVDVKNVASQ